MLTRVLKFRGKGIFHSDLCVFSSMEDWPIFSTRKNVDSSSPSESISRPLVLRKRFSATLLLNRDFFLLSAPNTSMPSSTAVAFDL